MEITQKSVGAGLAVVVVAVGATADLEMRQYGNIGLVPEEVAIERSGGSVPMSTVPWAPTLTSTDTYPDFLPVSVYHV